MRVGVDVGGTKTDVVVLDGGALRARVTVPSGRGEEAVVAGIGAAVDTALAQAGIDWSGVSGVGIGVPGGVVDGVVSFALNLGVEHMDLAAILETLWGVRPAVENDVNAAALGVFHHVRAERSLAYLNLGTGLAAGIVLDGRLWSGSAGGAGEVGHVSIDPSGPLDGDGIPGCLETYASGSGVARQWAVEGQGAPEVFAAAAAGDSRASEILQGVHLGLASAVRLLVLTYDIDVVYIGGGLSAAPGVLDGAATLLHEWASASGFLASLRLAERMRQVPSDVPFAAIGAAGLGA